MINFQYSTDNKIKALQALLRETKMAQVYKYNWNGGIDMMFHYDLANSGDLIMSGYATHPKFGITDTRIDGLSEMAQVGEIAESAGVKYICVSKGANPRQKRERVFNQTSWVKLDTFAAIPESKIIESVARSHDFAHND